MITISGFSGEMPRITPRLLPDSAAQVAKNCKLLDGAIMPIRYSSDHRILGAGNVMFYKRGGIWFEWNKVVDVVNAPIAANRLYFTGDGSPKIVTDDASVYPLAVRAPTLALTASVTGTPSPASQTTITYAYTYVTAYDEESEPSPLSNEVTRSAGMDVTLTGFVAPPVDRNYNRIRIYRSQTGASGVTELYFIKEVVLPVPTPSFIDIVEDNPIQEVIPSLNYNAPPEGLTGIIALPNGMLAGFLGNKLYFSEPYIPHAWPEKYVLTTNFDIVGLGAFGHSIAILTTGNPYIATGISPDAMAMELVEVNYPCVNKRGIVDLGYSVAYPSNDGLVLISTNGAQLATRQLFTRDQWQAFSPETIVASQYEWRYLFCYNNGEKSETVIVDLTGEQPFITRVDLQTNYMFFEIGAGKLYVLNGSNAQEWDSTVQPFMQATWRSKKIVLDGPINFGASLIDGEQLYDPNAITIPIIDVLDATLSSDVFPATVIVSSIPPVGGSFIQFEIDLYADGQLVHTFTNLNNVVRLPSGFMARTWEVEVRGNSKITSIYLAWSPSELYVGAR